MNRVIVHSTFVLDLSPYLKSANANTGDAEKLPAACRVKLMLGRGDAR
jgi:hypothetical protein